MANSPYISNGAILNPFCRTVMLFYILTTYRGKNGVILEQSKLKFFLTYGTTVKVPSESQDDQAKIELNMKFVIFGSMFT